MAASKAIPLLCTVLALSVVTAAPVLARRDVMPGHAGSVCVNACKEPWRGCFRRVCSSIPGFRSAPGQYRAQAEALAKTKCSTEWNRFLACKSGCKDASLTIRLAGDAPLCRADDLKLSN